MNNEYVNEDGKAYDGRKGPLVVAVGFGVAVVGFAAYQVAVTYSPILWNMIWNLVP